MNTRPCPHCGAIIPEQARFCGQCGRTISAVAPTAPEAPVHQAPTAPPPPQGAAPDAKAQDARAFDPGATAKVARTLFDPGPFGDDDMGRVSQVPTPVVPPPDDPFAQKTSVYGATIADPEVDRRAQILREALGHRPNATMIGSPDDPRVAAAPPAPEPSPAPKPFGKTMMLGGAPAADPLPDQPAAPTVQRPEPSPLSKSVSAPNSWLPTALNATSIGGVGEHLAQPPAPAPQPSAPAAPAPQPAPVPAPTPAPNALGRTMLGMPATGLPAAPSAAAPAPAPVGPGMKTMVGVAIPGIAPTRNAPDAPSAPVAPPAPATAAAPAPAGPVELRSKHSTMLGVAAPGLLPAHIRAVQEAQAARTPTPAPIVPAPPPLVNEPLPEAPRVPVKRGVPAVAVVGIVFAVVAVAGGIGAYFASRSGGTLTAQPQLDDSGRETLRIGCPSCPNGTIVALGASSATVQTNAAVLPLPAPLSIGENDLTVKIDRPATGRDEDVTVHVPVAYRVRTDLTTLTAMPPVITVRVEATPGTDVRIDDKPVTLDAAGRGAYAVDLTAEVDGPRDDAKPFERKIPFAITPKGGKVETGTLTARTTIVPLHFDAPGALLYTDKSTAAVSGQTRPNAILTIDGQPTPVDAQGRFAVRVALPADGDKTLAIVASAPPFAPRTVHAKIVRTSSLDATSKTLDGEPSLGFDAFASDPASKVGQKAVVAGEVIEVRVAGGQTVLLVDERRSCAAAATAKTGTRSDPPCLVRVIHGDEDKVARGDKVRAYGRIAGAVTSNGKSIPDVDAALVVPVKATTGSAR